MSTAFARDAQPEPSPDDRYVLPPQLTTPATGRGPRFDDQVWNFRPFVPRTAKHVTVDFSRLTDPISVLTAKEYLYSRLTRAVPAGGRTGHSGYPMKVTAAAAEYWRFRLFLDALRSVGAPRLADVTQEHLDAVVATWKKTVEPQALAGRITTLHHLAAHGPFLTGDTLTLLPWRGRSAASVAAHLPTKENTTPRIPEPVMAPLLRAAVFYIEVAGQDILAALDEVNVLEAAQTQRRGSCPKDATERVRAFIDRCRRQSRGIPALPAHNLAKLPETDVVDGVVQAPNQHLIALMAGVCGTGYQRALLRDAGSELGYEEGGLDTAPSIWPDTGRPWRPRFGLYTLHQEVDQLRTAGWIVCAYLSGMRDGEIRELPRDCAFTAPGEDGRIRFKLRGRVFKGRKLTGDEADWVVLPIVHQAVEVLLRINDDPTHLFGYRRGDTYHLISKTPTRLCSFRDHVNRLFSTPDSEFIPQHGELPWNFNTRQFRRTLAWHIAHQPFGVVAGTKQYQHTKTTIFEGYAGTSASGFAAEVEAEEAIATLDYLEDLYRDFNDGARAGGGASARINDEFARIRRELGDLPGVVSDEPRLRTMLKHLTKTLHPGVLNDCFFNPETAICIKKAAATAGRPLPRHNSCLRCPNARRSTVHLPRLTAARDQALAFHAEHHARDLAMPPLQHQAITTYLAELGHAIAEVQPA